MPDRSDSPLRLLIYDRTCRGGRGPLGLSHTWQAGSWLYRMRGCLDAAHGVASWDEALRWLATFGGDRALGEIQFWGHGKWGRALIDGEPLDRQALQPAHALHDLLRRIRQRLAAASQALWWFRTCETFGARPGHDFAAAWTDFFGCRAAGHTYIIAYYQSGLHCLAPGEVPGWELEEGLASGTVESPEQALWSRRCAPNTITCLRSRIPRGFYNP